MAVTSAVSSICTLGATLGEGPIWSAQEHALWFVDIKQRLVHRFDPSTGALRTWPAPAQPGWLVPAADGGFVVGLRSGLHRFDPADGGFSPLVAPESDVPGNRLNDATVAGDGAIWFGSMDDAEAAATGRVYRYAAGVMTRTAIAPVTIVNGPALSPDGRTLYHVDTLGRRVWAMPVDADGALGEARPFAEIEPDAGYPDGPTVDAEGHVWIALFGGWGVRRYAPDGRPVRTVAFPVANVTKIAFGGDGLRTAFATTARKGLDAAALEAQPLAGDLFAFDPGTAGLPTHAARL